ncbi:MAG: indolepyruvate ferredoxin oxidoreductase, partial [Burkholderiales bacterium 21-58-4]
ELSKNADEVIARRILSLTGYQNDAYAQKYKALVDAVSAADEKLNGKPGKLTDAVARYYYKLMAYKDEYEVARLYTDGQFLAQLKQTFDGKTRLRFNLAPPLLAKRDKDTGELKKAEYGAWVLTAFRLLAKLKGLRGTALDIFGYSEERRTERRLIGEYKAAIEKVLPVLNKDNYALAVELASVPEHIRGYGHVKLKHIEAAKKREAELLEKLDMPAEEKKQAA